MKKREAVKVLRASFLDWASLTCPPAILRLLLQMTSREAPWAPRRIQAVRAAHAAHSYDDELWHGEAVERRLAFGHGDAAAFQPVVGTAPCGLSPARVTQGEMALRAAPCAPAPAARTVAHFAHSGDSEGSCAVAHELKF